MPAFEYTGQLSSGSAITGTIELDGPEDAAARLEAMGIRVTSVTQAKRIRHARPLSRDDFLYFNQQLASLAKTGIALDQGLRLLAKDLRRGRMRRVVEELAEDLDHGVPFEKAVERRSGLFPPLYAEILKSGVKNNQLGSTLCNLNTHLSLVQETRRMFWESASYPLIILILGLGVLTLFMTAIVPQYEELIVGFVGDFSSGSGWQSRPLELPPLTRAIFNISHHWTAIASTVVALLLGLVLVLGALRMFKPGRRVGEFLIMLVPGLGGIHLASVLARFSQAAALSSSAGHDLPAILRLAAGATGHQGLIRDAENLSGRIEAGASSPEASKETRLIPSIFAYTALIAGRRGQLAAAFADMARNYDAIARHRIAMLRVLLAPFLLVMTAVVLGLGIMALFEPLSTVTNSISGM